MVILRVKRFKIVNGDTFYALNFSIPPEWMVCPVEQCREVPPRELDGVIVPSPDPFDCLLLAQFQFVFPKRRISEYVGKDF